MSFHRRMEIIINNKEKQTSSMTFVSRAPKNTAEPYRLSQFDRVGPASYDPCKDFIKDRIQKIKQRPEQHHNEKGIRSPTMSDANKKINAEIGPGKYEVDEAHKKFMARHKPIECGSAFKSGMKRFEDETSDRYKQMQKIIKEEEEKIMYEILMNKKKEQKNGKLFGIVRDRTKISQSIPSIPANSQSYGYRVDVATKKLVANESPHVLLARKSMEGLYPINFTNTLETVYRGPGSYFHKQRQSNKGPKWCNSELEKINQSQQQSLLEENESRILEIQREELESKRNSILADDKKKWAQKGNPINHKGERFDYSLDSISKKKYLLMNSLKKKFQKYISTDETATLQKMITGQKISKINQADPKKFGGNSKNNVECFLSKEARFRNNQVRIRALINNVKLKCIQNQQLQCQGQNDQQRKTKTPFMSTAQRFKHSKIKSNKKIGPGSYDSPAENKKSVKKASIWSKQTEQRFKDQNQYPYPGPGQYDPKASQARNFPKIRDQSGIQNLENSTKNGDEKIQFCLGRTQQDLRMKKSSLILGISPNTTPQITTLKNRQRSADDLSLPSKVLRNIKNMIENENDKDNSHLSLYEEPSRVINVQKKIKRPQIPYHPVDKPKTPPGPGHFQLDRQFIKKTHNVTYD